MVRIPAGIELGGPEQSNDPLWGDDAIAKHRDPMGYPSLDAIQEVKVLTSNYGAQFGRTASGTVQVTTKSGGNHLHGEPLRFHPQRSLQLTQLFRYWQQCAALSPGQDFGGTIGGPLTIPHVFNTKRDKTFFSSPRNSAWRRPRVEYNQAVPSLKERGLVMTAQGIQRNLSQPSISGGVVSQVFDFSDVCPQLGTPDSTGFSRQKYPDCPSTGTNPNSLIPIYNLLGQESGGLPSNIGVDKNALAILNSNLIPLPNSPDGCNFSVANLDPTDPNH